MGGKVKRWEEGGKEGAGGAVGRWLGGRGGGKVGGGGGDGGMNPAVMIWRRGLLIPTHGRGPRILLAPNRLRMAVHRHIVISHNLSESEAHL